MIYNNKKFLLIKLMIPDIKNKYAKTKDLDSQIEHPEKEDQNSTDILSDIEYVKNNILKEEKRFNKNFELLNSIKAGSSGAVYKGKYRKNKKDVAIKIMNQRNSNNKEVLIHKKLNNQNISTLYGFYSLGKNNSFIAMEYNNHGDLENFKKYQIRRKCLSETLISYITGNLVEGLHYLHKNYILHLNIKPQNILVNGLLNFKIADFSVSMKYNPSKEYIDLPLVGTSYYMSPEVLERKTISVSDASKIDIYSLGVLLYFLAYNDYPYELDKVGYNNYKEIRKNIEDKKLIFPESRYYSDLFKNFLEKCLEKDIEKRYNIYQVMNDPWVKGHQIILDEKDNLYNAGKFMAEMLFDNIRRFNDYIKSNGIIDI